MSGKKIRRASEGRERGMRGGGRGGENFIGRNGKMVLD